MPDAHQRYRPLRILAFDDHRERAAIFWKMQAEGLDRTVLYESAAPHIVLWHQYSGPPNAWCAPVYDADGALAAAGWLNGFLGRTAFCHFVVFRDFQADAVAIGKLWLRAMFGTGSFDSLCGLTPAAYRHALRFIRQLGFTLSPLTAPGACFLARAQRHVDGVFSCITPEDI